MKKNTMTKEQIIEKPFLDKFAKAADEMTSAEQHFYQNVARETAPEILQLDFGNVREVTEALYYNLITAYAHGKMDKETRDAVLLLRK